MKQYPPIVWFIATLGASAGLGCSGDESHLQPHALSLSDPSPTSSIRLDIKSELPLQLDHFEQVDSAQWVAVDRSSKLWLVRQSGGKLELNPVQLSVPLPGTHLASFVKRDRGMLAVETRGSGVVLDTGSWAQVIDSRIQFEGAENQVLGVEGLPDGSFAVFVHWIVDSVPGRFGRMPVVQHNASDGSFIAELWRGDIIWAGDPKHLYDNLSFAVVDDSVFISGASPARVYAVSWEQPDVPTMTRLVSPERPVSDLIRAEFGKAIRQLPKERRRLITLPEILPAVIGLRPFDQGYLVVAITGGKSGDAVGLDWYCRHTFFAAVLQGNDIEHLSLLPTGAMVMRDQSEMGAYVLQFYDYDDLQLECK